MSPDEHSLRKLMPSFVISAGTQVVLKVAKALPGGRGHKPSGSVGMIVESPASNRERYVVRFADGPQLRLQ